MFGAGRLNTLSKSLAISRTAKTITAIGNTQISTTQSKFGGASAFCDGTGDWLSVTSSSDFAFGTGDFTIEFWGYYTNIASGECFYDQRSSDPQATPVIYYQDGNKITYYSNGANQVTGGIVSLNVWNHISVCRASNTTRLFLNGVSQGTPATDNNNYVQGGPVIINGRFALDFAPAGYIDEIRISNIARYTSNFTPSSSAFTNDSNTLLLVHCNGTNGSTTFTDDIS